MEPNEAKPRPVRGYTGWIIPDADRDALLTIVPPIFPDVLAHHITAAFGVRDDHALPTAATGLVTAVATSDAVQALIVEIDGSADRPDGSRYHCTWSIDRAAGAKPKDSNNIVHAAQPLPHPVPITIVPTFFPFNPPAPAAAPAPAPEPQAEPRIEDEPFSESKAFKQMMTAMKLWGLS